MTDTISATDDMIDVRDIIARIEELREEQSDFEHDEDGNLTGASWADSEPDAASELATLESLMSDLAGTGGDEQWEGKWYPLLLIHDTHFEDYARELAEDIGAIPDDACWPCTCIDWAKAAREMRMDYTSVEFGGQTFWTR